MNGINTLQKKSYRKKYRKIAVYNEARREKMGKKGEQISVTVGHYQED